MNVVIFEMTVSNALRYNSNIIQSRHSAGIDFTLFVDDDIDVETKAFSHVEKRSWWSFKRVCESLQPFDAVIVNAQRMPDLIVIAAANSMKKPIFYNMHGLYIPFMKRDVKFFWRNLAKSVRFIYYTFILSAALKKKELFGTLILNFVFGRDKSVLIRETPSLQVTKGFVWSDFWNDWHQTYWGMYPELGWQSIGNPDLQRFSWRSCYGSITYVYQTLVEDGRISPEIMSDFYKDLVKVADRTHRKVVVRWHPRGSNIWKQHLLNLGYEILEDDVIPYGDYVIGHYSSLLGAFPLKNVPVIIVQLPGHDTPEEISELASLKCYHDCFLEQIETFTASAYTSKARERAIFFFGQEPLEFNLAQAIQEFDENKAQCKSLPR